MKPTMPLLLLAATALTGCDQIGLGGETTTTDTNMRSVDIEAGTASDEMIILDTASGDGTAIDPSSAVGPAAPRPADAGNDEGDDAPSSSGAASAPTADADAPSEPAEAPEAAEQ